ncbi:hypothetical protein PNBC_06760 [Paenibacillus crassostreae]|uniref:Uncharacterized protein n=1 Tax=Paenibacillus crassostreae TaxID=1763538 RepID=A0A167G0E8_9BACL|nr:hypothetical protein LPB68_17975 [Paenibacillus crassostreae]OAB77084.1 hypothetical protein PNBC_06760 [Paenibacillus crassostreae]
MSTNKKTERVIEDVQCANFISATLFFVLNLMGLPGSPSAYEIFLIIVMLVFNILIFGYAWRWSKQKGRVHS